MTGFYSKNDFGKVFLIFDEYDKAGYIMEEGFSNCIILVLGVKRKLKMCIKTQYTIYFKT